MSLRIAHVITSTDLGGAERALQQVSSRLSRRGHRQLVIGLGTRGPVAEEIEEAGIEVVTLEIGSVLAGLGRLRALSRSLGTFRPDVVQSWMYHADLAVTICRPFVEGRPGHVWNVRGSARDFSSYPAATRLTVRACAALARLPDAVVVNSDAGREFHARMGYGPKRWDVIPNGFDTSRFHPDESARVALRQEFGLPGDAVVVGHVARLHPIKDHPTFLDAFAAVASARPDAWAVLIGTGIDEASEALARRVFDLGVGDRVVLAGPRTDVHRLLPGMDLLCSSSISEGFPNVVGEAMSCGVPCVVTDVGDSRFLVGDTGIVVPPRDPVRLSEGLQALLSEPAARRAERGRACRRRIEDHFDVEVVVSRYEELYSEMAQLSAREGE